MNRGIYFIVVIFIIWIISVYVRLNEPVYLMGADALEATYHVMWTMQALDASPVSAHGWLPTVTMAPLPGDVLEWGATKPTAGGALIYTSFPPLGFLAPYWLLTGIDAPLSLQSLFWLNSATGLLTALLVGHFCAMVATRNAEGDFQPGTLFWPWFAGGAVLYLFLAETLVSHGATYWPHSLSQPVFVTACCLMLRQVTATPKRRESAGLVALCALYCALEWTGFVFSAGVILLMLWQKRSDGWNASLLWSLPGRILIAAGLVLLLTVVHFGLYIGFDEFLDTSASRAAARTGRGDSSILLRLGIGYFWSFGLLVPLGILAAIQVIMRRQGGWIWGVAFITTFPLVENLLLMNHALYFPFDRMKAMMPLVLACVLALRSLPVRRQIWVGTAGLMLVAVSNLYLFDQRTHNRGQWAIWDAGNRALVAEAQRHPYFSCAIAGSGEKVRGYLNLLIGRDIYEHVGLEVMERAVAHRSGCAIMIVDTEYVMTDLPRLISIEIFTNEGILLDRFF